MTHTPDQVDVHGGAVDATDDEQDLAVDHRQVAVPDEPGDIVEADEIVDGEIVEETETAEPRSWLTAWSVEGRAVVLRPPPRLVRVARALVEQPFTLVQGWHSWLVRLWGAMTYGVYRRQIRAAEVKGDLEALAAWVERKERAVAERRNRLADLPIVVVGLFRLAIRAAIAAGIGLPVLAILIQMLGAGSAAGVIDSVAGAVRMLVAALAFAWHWLWLALALILLVGGWREGRRAGVGGRWLVGGGDDGSQGRDVIPDEGAILNALRKLGIAELNRAFKEGWRPRFPLGTGRDGKGWRTQLELPAGVTVEMINLKKKVLAHNLVRHAVEVWPTEPRELPGVLDLWVADSGALTGPVEAWPLLKKGSADYFKGVPVAVDIRGKVIVGRLAEANWAVAGMMGSGKSTLVITATLGALTDPLVEADVFVMAENADYDPMKPRLRTLLTGAGDEVAEACLDTLREVYSDLSVRGTALKEHGVRAVNRQLAEADPRLRPRLVIVDECQALFMNERLGEEALEIAVKVQSAARKYAVTLKWITPEPSTASLPRRLIAVTSNKACFAIGDQQSNDAVLGTGSYKAGISAVGLEPKTEEGPGDVGTFMARGFTAKPGLLRGYYITPAEAHQVIERALQLREQAGLTAAARARDLLEDLDAVLPRNDERVRLADLPSLLRRHAPNWLPYRGITGTQLRDLLAEQGVRVTNTGNVLRVDPADVRLALARRNECE